MIRYGLLAHGLRINFDIIMKVGSTFVIAQPNVYIAGVKHPEENLPLELTILVVVSLVQLLVPLELFRNKEVFAPGPH